MAGKFSPTGLKEAIIRKEIIEHSKVKDDTYESMQEIAEIKLSTESHNML